MHGIFRILRLHFLFCVCSLANAQNIIAVTSTGGVPDSSSAGSQNRQALIDAFNAAGNTGTVLVPPGNFYVDNSAGAIFIQNFSGSFIFEGGSSISFLSGGQEGLRLSNWTGARIRGMQIYNLNLPPDESGHYEVIIQGGADVTVENAVITGASSTALQFIQSIRPKAHNIVINGPKGNGFEVANCQDAEFDNINVQNPQGDGIAILNYTALNAATPYSRVTAKNLNVFNASQSGIKVAGESDVVVDGFVVDIAQHGVICLTDTQFGLGPPENVLFQHGVVNNYGLTGIEFEDPASCSFSDIDLSIVYNGTGGPQAVFGSAPNGEISLSNIRAAGTFTAGAKILNISNSVSENALSTGFVFTGPGILNANHLTAINASSGPNNVNNPGPPNTAFWFRGTGFSNVSNLNVIDTQTAPTGYIIGGTPSQAGIIDGVIAHFSNGAAPTFAFAPNTFDVHNNWSR